jgi:carbonic anhydrase
MSVIDEILAHNEAYADRFDKGHLPMPPAKRLAAVVCMDARLETGALLALVEGDAHVIRNAGGVVTDDVIRSLTISQRLLGTREIMLIHHTDCGMLTFNDEDLKQQILDDTGIKPPFAMESFSDLGADAHQSPKRVLASPFIPHWQEVRGFV